MEVTSKIVLPPIKCFVFFYDVITFVFYFLCQKPWKKWKADKTIWAKHVREGDPYSSCVRVWPRASKHLEHVGTVDELFRLSVKRYGNMRCLGTRQVIAEVDEYSKNGKVLKKWHLGGYRWYSYIDTDHRIESLSNGLLELGCQPRKPVLIFAETRIEWMLMCQACFRLNVPVATLYTTLGNDGIIHGINETEVTHIITTQALLGKLKSMVNEIPAVTHIIYMENLKPADTEGFPQTVSLIPFSHVEKMGENVDLISKPDPPGPDDVAMIMYTSGSTGIPKGVMVTHKNLVSTASGIVSCQPELNSTDTCIAFLPLAHIYEVGTECSFISKGIPIGYSSPFTVTDKSTGIVVGTKGDASVLQPTMMCTVPLMCDRIKKAVLEEIRKKGPFAQHFFEFALSYKQFWFNKGFQTPILNRLVFKKMKDMVGGRLNVICSAGAPLSPDTHDFMRLCFDVKFIIGYGLTETSANGCVMSQDDYYTGRIGPPLCTNFMKLVDWPEGNYYVTDKPHPRGEIVIGGDSVSPGYFKNEELSKDNFKIEDGIRWFYTGDIAEICENGTFKLLDRKKDLVKLQYGEYISLGKVETELKTCPLIDNICVVANGFRDHLVALVAPNMEQLKVLGKSLGKEDHTLYQLCDDPAVIRLFMKVIAQQAEKSKLQRREIPTKVKLCAEEWLPETGLVTAAFKIRRKFVEQYYQNFIDEMYNVNTNGSSRLTN